MTKNHVDTSSPSNSNNEYDVGDDYTLVWQDEFQDDTLNTEFWNRQVVDAGTFNKEWQRYTDCEENAYIEDGCLVLQAIHENIRHGHNQYTSARLNTANKLSWKYGKIVARIKLPYSKGLWPAFWMLGHDIDENGGATPWPQCGEIDILELYGSNHDGVVEGNIHYANAKGEHQMLGAHKYTLEQGKFADDFHIFELEWTAKEIIWKVDGETYASVDIDKGDRDEFHQAFFILLNIAVGGTWAKCPDDSSVFPQKMVVDWIRVYQR